MCGELGLEKRIYDLWYCIPEVPLEDGWEAIENNGNVITFSDMMVYSTILQLYVTPRKFKHWNCEWDDFSFTQFLEDERVERVSGMIDESDNYNVVVENEDQADNVQGEDDDNDSFLGDSSNLDSTDSEAEITLKKKKRIPPPNPPYMTRNRGRFSMIRGGLFKNTEDNPVILDDTEPPASEGNQGSKGNGNGS
ncbi:hypothetical protein POM88_023044 [Heracleum sosnowskyi]|uniref:Uncharacterized protein n=1 Tax=Heracleum sosnowskyi TaxID=360622 RepID=A0AAD8MU87_9APIA|nr:hypothetical protein POM88_023044 [Heracleum sosnowskyi]